MQGTMRQDRRERKNQMPDFFDDRDDYETQRKDKRDNLYK
jgi:hypothetical protein